MTDACNSGVYVISNTIDGRQYVGSTVTFKRRFRDHARFLRDGKHQNKYLQNAWNKYGEEAFVFSVIEYVADASKLIEREQAWMGELKPKYNLCKYAGNTLGRKHSAETKRRLSEAGKSRSCETRAKMSVAAKARVGHGPDAVAAMTRANTGKRPRLGIPHTEETRLKMSLASKGKPKSPEHRAKLAAQCAERNRKRAAEMREARAT